jgi:phosphoadenosine phosphosulfate reductase
MPSANQLLSGQTPEEIVDWAAITSLRPVLTTNFRPHSIGLIHMVTNVLPDIPVLWVDSGYNTQATYQFVELVLNRFNLNIHIYRPQLAFQECRPSVNSIPAIGSKQHESFVRHVKLEPFERALAELQPDVWLTGIRADQTAYRRSLDTVSPGPRGITRIAPLLAWTEVDLEGYIYFNNLPDYDDYFDPTKGSDDRECGLQTAS